MEPGVVWSEGPNSSKLSLSQSPFPGDDEEEVFDTAHLRGEGPQFTDAETEAKEAELLVLNQPAHSGG